MDNFRKREDLETLPSYHAGKAPAPRTDIKTFKMSSNESPLEPLPEVLDALSKTSHYNLYPEPFAASLREKIAAMHDIDASHVLTAAGGLAIIHQVCDGLTQHASDEIIYPWRSFEAYPIAVQGSGAQAVPVPLKNHKHDFPAMLEAITENTKLIILCSPNNPTSTVIGAEEFEHFMNQVPHDITVLLDEAYYEFVTDPDAVRGDQYLEKYPNLITLRTFSKAYALAGLRIGYALCSKDMASYLGKISRPFEVSAPALIAGKISLENRNQALEGVHGIAAERERVYTTLQEYFDETILPEPQGNFIWLALGKDTDDFVKTLHQHGISTRPYGVGEGVRITIASPEANDTLLEAVQAYLED